MARNDHSGYPLKWFKDQNVARQFHECVVCLEVLKDAVQVRDCGHQFCALCIDDILKADPHCPTCRIEISDETIFDDRAARRLIKQLDVNCCNEKCTWHGPLSSLLQDHQKKCNFSIQNVHELKVQRLEQEFQALTLNVYTWNEKYEKDIEDIKLKYEQDIKEIKLKHERDVNDLKLKLQQSENRLQRLEEKNKESSEDRGWITPFVEDSVEPVQIKSQQQLVRDLSWEELQDFCCEEEKDFGSTEEEEGIQVENENVYENENDTELASPVKRARQKYDRDFLLQFQFMPMCTKKPKDLPNMEVVLDSPHPQKITGGSQRDGFFPGEKNQGGSCRRDRRGMPLHRRVVKSWSQSDVESDDRCLWPEQKENELSEEDETNAQANNYHVKDRIRSVISNTSGPLQKQEQSRRNRNLRLKNDDWLISSDSSSDESEISKDKAGVSVQEPDKNVNRSWFDRAPVYPAQAVMMQGQRPPYTHGYGMPMTQSSMRSNWPRYPSSSRGHSRMQGFIQQQNIPYRAVGQNPYRPPSIRPVYGLNVPQYQAQATSAPFQPHVQYFQQQRP